MDAHGIAKTQIDCLRKIAGKDFSSTVLTQMLNSTDFGLLQHENVMIRKIAMIHVFTLVRKVFVRLRHDTDAKKTAKEGDFVATLVGPFELSNGILYLVNQHLEETIFKAVNKNMPKWRSLNATTYKVFTYTIETSTGSNLLLGLDEHRLFEMLENPKLLISLPDPAITPIFSDLSQFSRDLKLVNFESYFKPISNPHGNEGSILIKSILKQTTCTTNSPTLLPKIRKKGKNALEAISETGRISSSVVRFKRYLDKEKPNEIRKFSIIGDTNEKSEQKFQNKVPDACSIRTTTERRDASNQLLNHSALVKHSVNYSTGSTRDDGSSKKVCINRRKSHSKDRCTPDTNQWTTKIAGASEKPPLESNRSFLDSPLLKYTLERSTCTPHSKFLAPRHHLQKPITPSANLKAKKLSIDWEAMGSKSPIKIREVIEKKVQIEGEPSLQIDSTSTVTKKGLFQSIKVRKRLQSDI